jgi:glycosyltransferase involved in cell wall biosynthesis
MNQSLSDQRSDEAQVECEERPLMQPRVSIIMPVRNEAAYIARSLRAVDEQDYPHELMEVIVSDGMSTDGTREVVHAFRLRGIQLHLIDNLERIAPTAMNRAMRIASGDVIVRVDGHCEIAPDYVRRCVAHLQQANVQGVGGPIETLGETLLAGSISAAMSSRFGVGGSAFRTIKDRTMLVDTVPFPAYSRSAIIAAGPYDEELVRNQDDEYNYRLRKLNGKILLAADVRSRYYSRSSLRSLWRQYWQYGYWKVRVLQKHPLQTRPRQFVPGLFVAAVTTCLLVGFAWPPGAWLGIGMAISYLCLNLVASLLTASRTRWAYSPLLPLVYSTLHFSYGLGFLFGLLRFAHRWRDQGGQVHVPSKASHAQAI